MFVEGISYALFKVAEQGFAYAAKILLRYGADVNFEGKYSDLVTFLPSGNPCNYCLNDFPPFMSC